ESLIEAEDPLLDFGDAEEHLRLFHVEEEQVPLAPFVLENLERAVERVPRLVPCALPRVEDPLQEIGPSLQPTQVQPLHEVEDRDEQGLHVRVLSQIAMDERALL